MVSIAVALFLVAGVVDGLGQELLGLGDEAGQGVQADGGVAEPVGGAQPGEGIDRLGKDSEAVVAGDGCGLLAGAGQAGSGRPAKATNWRRKGSSTLTERPSFCASARACAIVTPRQQIDRIRRPLTTP